VNQIFVSAMTILWMVGQSTKYANIWTVMPPVNQFPISYLLKHACLLKHAQLCNDLFPKNCQSRHRLVSSAAVIRVVTQRLTGEKRCVMTLITAAEETRHRSTCILLSIILWKSVRMTQKPRKREFRRLTCIFLFA